VSARLRDRSWEQQDGRAGWFAMRLQSCALVLCRSPGPAWQTVRVMVGVPTSVLALPPPGDAGLAPWGEGGMEGGVP